MGTGRTVSCSLAKVILAHCEALGVASASLARDCGFAGAAHFAATFRRHRGLSPSDYRRLS